MVQVSDLEILTIKPGPSGPSIQGDIMIDLQKLIEENLEQLKTSTKERLLKDVETALSYSSGSAIRKVVDNFMETEIAPSLKSHLEENKQAIVLVCKEIVNQMVKGVGDKILQQMNTKLEKMSSYDLQSLMEKMTKLAL